jgi:hypothetical protein
MVLNIHNFNGKSLITYQSIYSPEVIHLFKQFFLAAEQRNQTVKALIEKLQSETDGNKRYGLVQELSHQSEETELDIEIVKKLLL